MITLRRGVGRDSSIRQTERLLSSPIDGRLSPRSASSSVASSVYRAAATMIQSSVGSATMAILTGLISEVSQIAIAFTITMNTPIVDRSSRPVNATITGRANRLTRTRTAAQTRKPTGPAPRSAKIGAELAPNGNGWGTLMKPSDEDHDERDQRVDDRLDDESAHRVPPGTTQTDPMVGGSDGHVVILRG